MSSSKRGLSYQGSTLPKTNGWIPGYLNMAILGIYVKFLGSIYSERTQLNSRRRERLFWGYELGGTIDDAFASVRYVLKFCPFTATGMMPLSIPNSFKNSWSLPPSENLWRQIFLSKTLDQTFPNHHLVPHVFSELLWESWTCSNRNEVHKNYER